MRKKDMRTTQCCKNAYAMISLRGNMYDPHPVSKRQCRSSRSHFYPHVDCRIARVGLSVKGVISINTFVSPILERVYRQSALLCGPAVVGLLMSGERESTPKL